MLKYFIGVVIFVGASFVVEADNAKVLKCVEKSTMTFESNCVANQLAKDGPNELFFQQLAKKHNSSSGKVFSTVTFYPNDKTIKIKSMETKPVSSAVLIASR